jgi:hypothetical protein
MQFQYDKQISQIFLCEQVYSFFSFIGLVAYDFVFQVSFLIMLVVDSVAEDRLVSLELI